MGNLMFLIYIDDIAENLDTTCRLFADDYLIHKTYYTPQETKISQNDIYKLGFWSDKWMLNLNPSRCKVMYISNNKNVLKSIFPERRTT